MRVGRHVLVVGGGPGEGRPDLGDRPARVRLALALIPTSHAREPRRVTRTWIWRTRWRAMAPRARHTSSPRSAPSTARSSCPRTRAPTPTLTRPLGAAVPPVVAVDLRRGARGALDLGGARRRVPQHRLGHVRYFSALCAAARPTTGGGTPRVEVERHAELVDWARTRHATTDPAARIRAELAARQASSSAGRSPCGHRVKRRRRAGA